MPFQIIRNDITKVTADAIVNTANPAPTYAGGTDAAIYKAAGEKMLLAERKKIGVIRRGDAVETPAFHLDAKYIIHTVGPAWIDGEHGEFDILRSCYRNSLELAERLHCESIAFPLIATGVYGFPKDKALQIATQEIQTFLFEHEMEVYLVVFDRKSFELSGKIYSDIDALIDENYAGNRLEEEYLVDRSVSSSSVQERYRINRRPRLQEAESIGSVPEPLKAEREEGPRPAFTDLFSGLKNEKDLDKVLEHPAETFQQRLFALIDESGMTDVEVYKKANISRKVFSTIRSNIDYHPSKPTAVAFAIALQLDMEDTQDLLERSGYTLSQSSPFDIVIAYCISKKIYDIYDINIVLFDHNQPTLG